MQMIYSVFIILCSFISIPTQAYVLMLDPAGDAQTPGRRINDSFERSVTLQLVQELKKQLSQKIPPLTIILTRLPGDIVEPYAHAQFANRMHADLYLSIHCVQDTHAKPSLSLYYLGYGTETIMRHNTLALYSCTQVHLLNVHTTKDYAQHVSNLFTQEYPSLFYTNGPYQLPCTPLIGIIAPALLLELGIHQDHDWRMYIEPLITGITSLIKRTL